MHRSTYSFVYGFFQTETMVKAINIHSLLQAKVSLTEACFKLFLNYYGIGIKDAELVDFSILAHDIAAAGGELHEVDKFFVGYKIPQIGKEFDLLRFGANSIIDIEVKNSSPVEKIRAQLLRNHYYLKFTGKTIHAFTFVAESRILYFLDERGTLQVSSIAEVLRLIREQGFVSGDSPDLLFDPSDYLVSPFNSTSKFLAGEYFLTHQQEQTKTSILNSFQAAKSAQFFSITGSAGTGKTLLTYDIARHALNLRKTICLIHCGNLNEGHQVLTRNGWNITSIKDYKYQSSKIFDLIIVDEAQRIYQKQLDEIIEKVSREEARCIFSYDKFQTLSSFEERNNIPEKIEAIHCINKFALSEKIRTNKEIAAFLKMLFNNKKNVPLNNNGNVEVSYFSTTEDAKAYLDGLDSSTWEVLRFTPSQYDNEHHEKYYAAGRKTSHQVIGQEFDGVAIAVDKYFSYDVNGDLFYRSKVYYAPIKMLFQNITRARKRLNLVIIENEELLIRCMKILQQA